MNLRRGFKAEANSYAREFRIELGVPLTGPLCPWRLADHLDIPVITLSSLQAAAASDVLFLLRRGKDFFSAVTVFGGCRRVILHNDGNAKTRQAADIAHEIAHAVLRHPPELAFDENGERIVNDEAEEEAKWFGPALLVSDEAAVAIARSGQPLSDAAKEFGISLAVLQMRMNVSGAFRRAQRGRQA